MLRREAALGAALTGLGGSVVLGVAACTMSFDDFSYGPGASGSGGSPTGTATGGSATGTGGSPTGTAGGGMGGSPAGGSGGAGGSSSTCGNGGAPEAGEQCEDGNTVPGDRCGATCQIEYPEDCPGTPIGLDATPIVIQDDTQGGNDTVSEIAGTGPCFANTYPGEDLVYAVTPSHSGTVQLTLDADYTSHVLHVRTLCPGTTGDEVACDYSASTIQDDVVDVTATAGQPFYVFVDSYASTAGTFTLTIAPP